MDLGAYSLWMRDEVQKYIVKHYGDIPRCRGVRFMKAQKAEDAGDTDDKAFIKYCGQDVICIHTRCGECGMGWDSDDSNYVYCGGKAWEEAHKDLFLEHVADDYDCTYCDHYFKAVVDEEYNSIVSILLEARAEKGE